MFLTTHSLPQWMVRNNEREKEGLGWEMRFEERRREWGRRI